MVYILYVCLPGYTASLFPFPACSICPGRMLRDWDLKQNLYIGGGAAPERILIVAQETDPYSCSLDKLLSSGWCTLLPYNFRLLPSNISEILVVWNIFSYCTVEKFELASKLIASFTRWTLVGALLEICNGLIEFCVISSLVYL